MRVQQIHELQPQISGVRRIGKADFNVDEPRTNQFFDLAIEMLHSFVIAIPHGIEQ